MLFGLCDRIGVSCMVRLWIRTVGWRTGGMPHPSRRRRNVLGAQHAPHCGGELNAKEDQVTKSFRDCGSLVSARLIERG